MKCDVIKQNELELTNTILRYNQINEIVSQFPIVFETFQLLVSLEPITRSPWGFHQIKA